MKRERIVRAPVNKELLAGHNHCVAPGDVPLTVPLNADQLSETYIVI